MKLTIIEIIILFFPSGYFWLVVVWAIFRQLALKSKWNKTRNFFNHFNRIVSLMTIGLIDYPIRKGGEL